MAAASSSTPSPPEPRAHVAQIALQQVPGVRIAPGVHGLRQVDHPDPVLPHEEVERRQVAVHHVVEEHPLDLAHRLGEEVARLLRIRCEVLQLGRRPVHVADELHQDRRPEGDDRLGHGDVGRVHRHEGLPLVALPQRVVDLAAEPGLRGDGATRAAAHDPTGGVGVRGSEVPLLARAVRLKRHQFVATCELAAAAQVDRGLLAAGQRPEHLVDEAFLDERIDDMGIEQRSASRSRGGRSGSGPRDPRDGEGRPSGRPAGHLRAVGAASPRRSRDAR